MIDAPAILMPGGLRLRTIQPIQDRQGGCPLIYDLERNRLFEVPLEFQLYVAFALDKGELDEALIGWLASEDLMTYEVGGEGGSERSSVSELADLSSGCVYFLQGQIHAQLQKVSRTGAARLLDGLVGRLGSASRVTLHLNAGNTLDVATLRGILKEVERRPELQDRRVDYELTVVPRVVTPEMAELLRRHAFRVRARCDGPESVEGVELAKEASASFSGVTERGLRSLLDRLHERLTVHAVLRDGARLAYLWDWARELGVRRLHVTQQAPNADPADREGVLREFRSDLAAVSEEMFQTLQAEYPGLLYEPILRVVRRMAEKRSRHRNEASRTGCLGVVSNGQVLPFYGRSEAFPSAAAEGAETLEWQEVEGEDTTAGPCASCWSRSLCGRGVCADPALAPVEKLGRQPEHCDYWRAEVEAGLLFYHRLREADPDYLLGLVEPDGTGTFDPFDAADGFFEWKTC